MSKKKIGIICFLISAVLISGVLFAINMRRNRNNTFESGNIAEYAEYIKDSYIPSDGFVPDSNTAQRIAENILLPIYGKSINNNKPFIVKYDEKSQVWIVEGQLKESLVGSKGGGVPYVIIQKSDGKIIAVWHDK